MLDRHERSRTRDPFTAQAQAVGGPSAAAQRGTGPAQLAACALADALSACSVFWDDAHAVHCAVNGERAADRLARRYCRGERRAVIAELLARAAVEPGLRDAAQESQRLALIGIDAWRGPDDHGHRPADRAVMASLLLAGHLVAARGARECLGFTRRPAGSGDRAAETPCGVRAVAAGLYCGRHADAPSDRQRWDDERERSLRLLFALARPFILGDEIVERDAAQRSAA